MADNMTAGVKLINPENVIAKLADQAMMAKGLECSLLIDIICMLRAEPEAKPVEQRWIPVTERLPERGQEVIVFSGGYLKPNVFAYHFWSSEFYSWQGITHWMPMPEMPREDAR